MRWDFFLILPYFQKNRCGRHCYHLQFSPLSRIFTRASITMSLKNKNVINSFVDFDQFFVQNIVKNRTATFKKVVYTFHVASSGCKIPIKRFPHLFHLSERNSTIHEFFFYLLDVPNKLSFKTRGL